MCLAVPMKVVEIVGDTARVEQEGVSRKVRIDLLPGVELGDYVLVHAGITGSSQQVILAKNTRRCRARVARQPPEAPWPAVLSASVSPSMNCRTVRFCVRRISSGVPTWMILPS